MLPPKPNLGVDAFVKKEHFWHKFLVDYLSFVIGCDHVRLLGTHFLRRFVSYCSWHLHGRHLLVTT